MSKETLVLLKDVETSIVNYMSGKHEHLAVALDKVREVIVLEEKDEKMIADITAECEKEHAEAMINDPAYKESYDRQMAGIDPVSVQGGLFCYTTPKVVLEDKVVSEESGAFPDVSKIDRNPGKMESAPIDFGMVATGNTKYAMTAEDAFPEENIIRIKDGEDEILLVKNPQMEKDDAFPLPAEDPDEIIPVKKTRKPKSHA